MLNREAEVPPVLLTYATTLQAEDHAMTEATRRAEPVSPAPGGTAELAGQPVARIGFGAMQLERAAAGPDKAVAILRQAVAAGVNHLDTAQFYGACNSLIRAALAPYDDRLVLATKVGAVW